MFYCLAMLFLSFCAYAQEVYVEELDGKEHIVYVCNNGQKVTFPARLLKQSTVLNNVVNDAPEEERSGESRQKMLVDLARWFLKDVDENNIPAIIAILELLPVDKVEGSAVRLKERKFILPDGSQIDIEKGIELLFKVRCPSEGLVVSEEDRAIGETIAEWSDCFKKNRRCCIERLHNIFNISPVLIPSMVKLSNEFDIHFLYHILIKHVANRSDLWSSIADVDAEYDIISKVSAKIFHSMGKERFEVLKSEINARDLSLRQMSVLYNVCYNIRFIGDSVDEDVFSIIHRVFPEALNRADILFTPEAQKLFESVLKKRIQESVPEEAHHFIIENRPGDFVLLWRATAAWYKKEKFHINNFCFSVASLIPSYLPVRIIDKHFHFMECHLTSLQQQALDYMRAGFNDKDSYRFIWQQNAINKFMHQRTACGLFVAMAYQQSWGHGKLYKVADSDALIFFNFIKAIGKELNDGFLDQVLFDQNDINEASYKHYIFKELFADIKDESVNAFHLNKPVLQFLLHAYGSAWQYGQPIALQTQEDLDNCFAFNQELNKPKETHIAIAQVLRSNNLFVLSKKATDNVREKYLRKIYWRLRSKQIIKQDHLPLLRDLTLEQLNMLFRASHQPYELRENDLDMYYQLPDVCKTEKLFDQRILDTEKFLIRCDMNATRPNRLAESFANIAYNVKKLFA